MEIRRFITGKYQTNTYYLEIDNKVILIDPASKAEKMIDVLKDKKLIAVLLTHGHFDHTKSVNGLYEKYHMPVYIHEDDEEIAREKCMWPGSEDFISINCPTNHVKEGKLIIGPFVFEVIYTPGHTEGSVLYKIDYDLFSGDTLFKGSVGRTDLKGGSSSKLKQSLRLIKELDPRLKVHPGHEDETTIEAELNTNPFLL